MALPRFSFPAPGGRRSATPPAAGVLMPGDERFLHGSRQAELVEPMPRALWALYLLCVIVVVTGVWAAQARVDIVAKAPGKVAPGGHEQVIASLEGGLLAELLVREGDLVEAGAELVRLDPTRFAAQQNEGRARQLALQATAARLEAEAGGRSPVFPGEVRAQAGLVAAETEAFQARRRGLDEAIAVSRASLALLDAELATARQMAARGLMSEVEVLRLDRQRNDLQMQMAERINRFRQDAATDLLRVRGELAQIGEQQVARLDALQRTTLKAPVRGIVKNLRITTRGGVVGAGAPILELVPVGETVRIEARLAPSEVGFVRVGMPATIKLDSYDYYRYGGLQGEVEYISPDTLEAGNGPNGQPQTHYRVRVATRVSTLQGPDGRPLPVLPGMTASIEIRTGERSVLEFLISPMLKGREAFRER